MTEYGLSYASLPPPLDFSKHRMSPEMSAYASVLDLRVKKVGEKTDQNCRSMFEAYVASAGTPPSPPSPPHRGHGRTSSESTDDSSCTATPVESPSRNSRQNAPISATRVPVMAPLPLTPQATRMRHPLDASLYVKTTGYGTLGVSSSPGSRDDGTPTGQAPHTLASLRLQASTIPDTTAPISGSGSTLSRNRHSGPSQYYSAFHSLPGRDASRSFTQSSRVPAAYFDSPNFYRFPPFSEISHQDASRSLPVTVSGKNHKSSLKNNSEEPTSSFPDPRFSQVKPETEFSHARLKSEFQRLSQLKADEFSNERHKSDLPQFLQVKPDTDGSGSDHEQGQHPVSSDSGPKDEAYWERRRKNNEAAKKSRDARRAKEDEIAVKAAVLEKENICLKLNLAALRKEHQRLMLALR